MLVDKYCEDGLIFDVHYKTSCGMLKKRKMIFPISYTEEMVKSHLEASPHCMQIEDVIEIDYSIRLRDEFL